MKKFTYLAALLTLLTGVIGCQKNVGVQEPDPGKTRTVTITAGSQSTKTYVDAGNLKWSAGDKLHIVDQAGTASAATLGLVSGQDMGTGTFEGPVSELIEEDTDLYGWCGGSWTYSAGTFSVNMPSSQTYVANGLAKDAFPSIGTGSIDAGITLSNPMGILKLTVKGATTDLVKSITVTSDANNLAGSFTVNPSSSYAVTGGSSKTLTLDVASPYVALSSTGENFYIVLPPATYAANDLTVTVNFSDDSSLPYLFTSDVTVAANQATAEEISDHNGRRGTLNGHSYVQVKAKYDGVNDSFLKWATQNLAVTTSGQADWKGTGYVVGDYFNWAASYEGYGISTLVYQIPANLVVYDSFLNTCAGGASDSFALKTGKMFFLGSDPYTTGSSYSKYTAVSSTLSLSAPCDDAARLVLGSTWRIPTGGTNNEFTKMYDATDWTWDATDKGYYVTKKSEALKADKSNALLFFPAAGMGQVNLMTSSGSIGYYWLNVNDSDDAQEACYMKLNSTGSVSSASDKRYMGFSIRPVSE